ncbi:endonuclease/exonuclease/phosphatase family protein [Rhizosphaericola mali]|uniref:Endonuclease/exonuclease/phosphatase domain-containing protein n=1 Tax=Rhizosphaericola mali TaxID=2545455 RepID=A0A5P2G417_9BACT|nr:endonuclease/exonuclease/phosphatase family protein [Rhizosphaericola mali]QES90576.1 hypothetical protein E0W69_018580 [Rhizosphaericola mali]
MMKNYVVLLMALFLFSCTSSSEQQKETISSASVNNKEQLKIVSWNIEWFGSSLEGPKDKDLQEKNVLKILTNLNADIYALCEIVDTARFGNVVRQLPSDYQYFISDYASNAKNSNSSSWQQAQKMAFIVRKNLLTNIQVNGYLRNNGRLGYDLANGRYPYLLSGYISFNGKNQSLNVMILHAKSGADQESYNRRKDAANILAENIEKDFANEPFVLVGDFNDETTTTITRSESQSPYVAFSSDGFHILTSNVSGNYQQSTIHYSSIIDNQIVNNTLYSYYIPSSTQILGDVQDWIKDYKQGTTSDHYPVVSLFSYSSENKPEVGSLNTKENTRDSSALFAIENTLVSNEIKLQASQDLENVNFQVMDAQGKSYIHFSKRNVSSNRPFYVKCKELPNGDYSLLITTNENKQALLFTKQ